MKSFLSVNTFFLAIVPRPAASTGKLVHSVQLAPNHIFAVFFLCLQFLFSLPVSPSNLTGADTFMSN